MFKNLREKITVSDSNNKNTPGEQNLSRFSSISSLVSDVGSAFSKALTNPQHVQPSSRTSKSLYDFDSVSEYDDSISQGSVINKEELFQRYQRAQTLAKRYKTRSLEMMECYKQLELENTKLTQTLTESQDCSIRRVGELREQIELDKKAKNDIEENYQLMIDEKVELINVLRLQISLLKEGKDLPTELESQIKEKHDLEIQRQKMKDDEIKDLKVTMSQRENLLQRCKEKITSLNTQLTEMKMKLDSVANTSQSGDSYGEQHSTDLAKLSSQHAESLENLQREHSERIRNMLCDFENNKTILESEIHNDYEQKLLVLKQELKELNDKFGRVAQDNERLEEQVKIKTNIIEDLMISQDKLDKEGEKSTIIIDQSNCFEIVSDAFKQNFTTPDERADLEELKNEIKFLQGKIEQMETLKKETEEDVTKTEEDLRKLELVLKKERDDSEVRINSYKLAMEEMKHELDAVNNKCESLSLDVNNLNTVLAKKKEEIEEFRQSVSELEIRRQSLEVELKKNNDEKSALLSQLEALRRDNDELEKQIQIINQDYENDKIKLHDQNIIYKNIKDKCDELNSGLVKEIREKEKLIALLDGNDRPAESPLNDNDGLMLKIVEMRHVYDLQIEDSKDQIQNLESTISEKNALIKELESKICILCQQNETVLSQLSEMEAAKDDISHKFNTILREMDEYKYISANVEIEKEVLLKTKDENRDLIKEKENIILNLTKENERLFDLESKLENMNSELETLQDRLVCVNKENIILKEEIEQIQLKNIETAQLLTTSSEQLRLMTEEVELIRGRLEESDVLNNQFAKDNEELRRNTEELNKEFNVLKEKNSSLEENMIIYQKLENDYVQCKQDVTILQSKLDESCVSLRVAHDEVEKKNALDQLLMEECRKSAEEQVSKYMEIISVLEGKINTLMKYLNIFQNWTDGMVLMGDCGDHCKVDDPIRSDYWNSDYDNECDTLQEIASLGRNIERVIFSWHSCHRQLHQILHEKCVKENDTNEKFFNGISEFCLSFDDNSNVLNEEDILQRLHIIREDIDKRNSQLTALDQLLASGTFTDDIEYDENSTIYRLRKNIENKINDYSRKSTEKDLELSKLEIEKEAFLKRIEKMNNDRIQHFKVLSKILELSGIDFEEKNISKVVMKAVRDYAKKNVNLSVDLNSTVAKLADVELQLKSSIDECRAKDVKLAELTETISEDSVKLLTMSQELDKSVSRLNEFADEKGRIDEEKQSLRKELNELNEKIEALKLDCEKQVNDKKSLEKYFHDSLEKVKMNHCELEENYKKEIEKQFDYQQYLEEQITVNREESSQQISENLHQTNIKLEEVLKQSEQLLVLNNQYKELLDRSKTETNSALESLKQSEMSLELLENNLQLIQQEKESLIKSADESTKLYQQVINERDTLKMKLQALINEKEKSVEMLQSIQSSTRDIESEKLNFLSQIKELEAKNRSNNEEVDQINELLEKLKTDRDESKKENGSLVKQLVDEQTSSILLRSEIEEKRAENQILRNKIDSIKLKMKKLKTDHECEIFEIKQQFNDDKSTIDDDHNQRVKKVAKDFSEKMLLKEQDFQKTFQEALENVRKEEARQKNDLKDEIVVLNRMVMELELEKNSLYNTISDCEDDLKKLNSLLQTKESHLQTAFCEISDCKSKIDELERQVSRIKSLEDALEQMAKLNQIVDTNSCYEDQSLETVNANDHDILRMHCSDLEEQVRQLHLENISLKDSIPTKHQSPQSCHDHIVSASRSHQLTSQPSLDNGSMKSAAILNTGGSLRSPNTSCSEYQFCPYPITDATEYEYLRDVLVKYMTGMETNTLARVVCTVMKFSRDETERIVRFEQDKRKLLQIQIFS